MRRLLHTTVALFLLTNLSAQVPSYVPTDGLVGWWPFSGNANDESGNELNGAVNGATPTQDRFGNPSAAFSYSGNDDYVEIPTSSGLLDNETYTRSFWFKTPIGPSSVLGTPNVNPAILSRLPMGGPVNSPDAIDNWVVYEIGGSAHLNGIGGGGITGFNTVTDNSWHHIVYTRSEDSSKTFLDGTYIGGGPESGQIVFQSYPIRIGRSQHTYWRDLTGDVDDLGFWNRALSAEEIVGLYTGSGVGVVQQSSPTVELLVFPNPSSGKFLLKHTLIGQVYVRVFDVTGRLATDMVIQTNSSATQSALDLSYLAKGSYEIQLESADTTVTRHVVIE
ncbi:MAG: T9SS type A sorting domain-containing protein [Flavobacteriales bacterium]|nr:T9SS type A sorting domain-containing protein [Flavobacteriales bacterium]